MEKICPACGEEFEQPDSYKKRKKIYCSRKCQHRINERIRTRRKIPKEKNRKRFKKWIKKKKNIIRLRKNLKKYYERDKYKWNCKTLTGYLVYNHKIQSPKKECKICKSKRNLVIHHSIYPKNKNGIVKAIKNKKIYFLCKKHHSELRLIAIPFNLERREFISPL